MYPVERSEWIFTAASIRNQDDADDLLDEIIDRYGDPPKGVLNLIDIALLRANARKAGITDIKQKGSEVFFTLHNMNFEAIGMICEDPDYKKRIQFVASAKVPTLKLKLNTGVDSLKQCKAFVSHYQRVQ